MGTKVQYHWTSENGRSLETTDQYHQPMRMRGVSKQWEPKSNITGLQRMGGAWKPQTNITSL